MTIPEGYAQVTIAFVGVGLPSGGVITFGVANQGIKSASEICDVVETAWTSEGGNLLHSADVQVNSILVKLGPDDDGPSHLKAYIKAGTLSGAAAPNTAYLVSKSTARGGRKGRGRMFIPGVAEGDVSAAGVITAGRISSTNTVLSDIAASLLLGECPMALLHSGPETPDLVTDLELSARAATQRRRLRR